MKFLRTLRFKLVMLIGLGVSACSDVNPTVTLLRSVDGFEFTNSVVVTSSLTAVSLQATCSSLITDIEISFDDGATWMSASTYDASAKSGCEGGSFNVTLSSAKAPMNAMTISAGYVMTVKFRAQPRVGNMIYRDVTVKYSPSTPIKQEVLVSSSTVSGGGLVLRGRVRTQEQHTASGGSFVMKGRILQ